MGQYLKKLPLGSEVECKGPLGELRYYGGGKFEIQRKNATTHQREVQRVTVRKLGMIAGGSGITPMLQIVREVCKRKGDRDAVQISLIFANLTEPDILLREELDRLVEENKNFKVHYTLDKASGSLVRYASWC